MSAKLGFVAGLAVGVLAGSRAGRGLYDRTASAASAVVRDPRVRSGAASVMHKAGDAGSSAAGAAVRKVKNRGNGDGEAGEGAEGKGEGDAGAAALRARTKRLIGGVRKHSPQMSGLAGGGGGMKVSRPHLHLHRSNGHGDHADRMDHAHNGARHGGGMSAPSVQPKPIQDDE